MLNALDNELKRVVTMANAETWHMGIPLEASVSDTDTTYTLTGRVTLKRGPFLCIDTPYGKMETLVRMDNLLPDQAAKLRLVKRDDNVAVTGPLMTTKTGILVVMARQYENLSRR